MNQASKIREEFVEFMGLTLQADGFSRIAGRIFGLLLITREPLTADDLCDRLQISRGSVSTNCRTLEGLDVIERVCIAGERKDHFQVPGDPFSQFMRGHIRRLSKNCEKLDGFIDSFPSKDDMSRDRLRRMRRFWGLALKNSEELVDELAQPEGGRRVG